MHASLYNVSMHKYRKRLLCPVHRRLAKLVSQAAQQHQSRHKYAWCPSCALREAAAARRRATHLPGAPAVPSPGPQYHFGSRVGACTRCGAGQEGHGFSNWGGWRGGSGTHSSLDQPMARRGQRNCWRRRLGGPSIYPPMLEARPPRRWQLGGRSGVPSASSSSSTGVRGACT